MCASGISQVAPGMRRSVTQVRERKAVRRVAGTVEDDLDRLFREQPLPDYGVDAQAEVVAGDQLATGRLLGLQIRGGNSRFARPKGNEGGCSATPATTGTTGCAIRSHR